MSAFCCNSGLRAMNVGSSKSTAPTITVRPTPEDKWVFATVAARRQMSESTLALIAIRALLESQTPDLLPTQSSLGPALDRITIRLRPGDRLAIRHRAAERRMKDSGNIAALVRSHLAANPPLTTHELAAFKAGVSVLAGVARSLARIAQEASQTGDLGRDLQRELKGCRALVADVERRMHEFARASLISWESRID